MIFDQSPADRKVRVFTLSPAFLVNFEDAQPQWGPVGHFTFKRTYARPTCDCEDPGHCEHPTEEFWQTCKRVVDGVYNIQKHHCRRLGLPWNEPKAQKSAQDMFTRMWEFKFTPPGRGLWQMGTDFMWEKGGACLNNPLHEDTPVLTRDQGWVPIGSLAGQEKVTLLSSIKLYGRDHTSTASKSIWVDASMSHIEVQPCKRLVLRDNSGFVTDLVVSENHRWFRRGSVKKDWERVTTLDLNDGDQLPVVLPAKVAPVSHFGAQHGLFFGDGTRSNGELHQFDVSVQVLQDLFGSLAVPVDHRRDDEWVVRNCPRAWGQSPASLDDISYIYGFLAGYFAADGCVAENGSCSISSARKAELDEVRRLFLAIGVRVGDVRLSSTSSNYSDERELWTFTPHTHDLWDGFFLRVDHRERWGGRGQEPKLKYAKVIHIEDAGEQRVLCAVVPDYEQFVIDGFVLTSNCAFTSSEGINEDFAGPFVFLMDMSMLGVGVGGDTRGAGKVKVQQPRLTDVPYVVGDSREGWVAIARTVINSFAGRGAFPSVIDFSEVRPRGRRIHGFGGIASGPGPLAKLIKNVSKLLIPPEATIHFEETFGEDGEITRLETSIEGEGNPYRITSTGITDVFNMVGACVVAGGVRRSAEIMFGNVDDAAFRNLKDPSTLIPLNKRQAELKANLVLVKGEEAAAIQAELDEVEAEIQAHPLVSHRWASNNSIFAEVGMDYAEIGKSIAANGEPGLFWLGNAQKYGRMVDAPNDKDWRAMGGNPCFAGDTLIATADGRGAVSIKQLVDEGTDVPVYSVEPNTGMVEIQMARNPRQTRESSRLVEIELDDGSTFKVTPDHKMLLLDGRRSAAADLQPGDSLPRFTKRLEAVKRGGHKYLRVNCDTRDTRQSKVFEHRLIARFHDPDTWDHVYDEAKQPGWVKGGLVVHHKDYDPTNNHPENLEIMSFRDHQVLHGSKDNRGENNPMWGRTQSEATRRKIGQKTLSRCADPDFLLKLSLSHTAAERAEASDRMTEQRKQESVAYYQEQEARTDLDTVWMQGRLHAVKTCETCDDDFIVPWRIRHQLFCSRVCLNKAESHIVARKKGQAVAFAEKQRQTLHRQVMVFKGLQDQLDRTPMMKEWEAACRGDQVPFRIRKARTTTNPHALTSYGHLQQVAVGYNHRVVAVRYVEAEPVYNLTVDQNHTVGIVVGNDSHGGVHGIFTFQCLEQTLEPWELCTLVETYPAHHETYEDFEDSLKAAYLYAKSVTLMPTHDPRTNAVMNRNRRIGCSMSGIRQAIAKFGRRKFLNWCEQGYAYIQKLDRTYAEWLGIPLSIKTTSVKPSGCRPWSALTSTNQGLLTLEDLFEHHPADQEWVKQPNPELKAIGTGLISKTFNNGVASVLRITTSYGIEVESTPNHHWWIKQRYDRKKSPKYQDVNEWRRTDEIQPGDILDITPGVYNRDGGVALVSLNSLALNMRGDATEIQQPKRMNPQLAWLLGYLWGDGAMSPSKYHLRWVDDRRENLEKTQAIIKDQFGLDAKIKQMPEPCKAYTLDVGSKHLWHWLIRNDVFKLYADKINIIPRVIRASGHEEILAFLAGLLDADGCTSKSADDSVLIWTMADPDFARHVQDVALAVGVVVGRSHITGGSSFQKRRSMFHLTASGHTSPHALAMLRRHSTNVADHEARSDFAGWRGQVAGRDGQGLILGKVLKVEPVGEMPTFDIEVVGDHWYYAGAIKSHNTVSLLCGATPGVHPPHSEFYIRNIRVAGTSPLIEAARTAGYKVEKDRNVDDTFVISFPIHEKDFGKGKQDVSIWEQFALAADMQRYWADNQVSATVTFTASEASEIPTCLEVFEDRMKGVSLLPISDHGYVQAPYITIDADEYQRMMSRIIPMDFTATRHEITDQFCDGEACLIPR